LPHARGHPKLASDPGDYIGGGRSYRYTKADAALTVQAIGGRISGRIVGDQRWGRSRVARPDPLVWKLIAWLTQRRRHRDTSISSTVNGNARYLR